MFEERTKGIAGWIGILVAIQILPSLWNSGNVTGLCHGVANPAFQADFTVAAMAEHYGLLGWSRLRI
jgi:hypothetical protein